MRMLLVLVSETACKGCWSGGGWYLGFNSKRKQLFLHVVNLNVHSTRHTFSSQRKSNIVSREANPSILQSSHNLKTHNRFVIRNALAVEIQIIVYAK